MSGVTYSIPPGGVRPHHLNGQQSGEPPVYGCRAWVNFNGSGVVAINESGNVSSVTDNGVGDYTVNFLEPMQDKYYSVVTGGYRDDSDGSISNISLRGCVDDSTVTANGFRVLTANGLATAFLDFPVVTAAVFR